MRRVTAELQVADYEKVFAVLDACDDAADFTEFRRAVVDAIRQVFEVRGVTFFTGPSVAGAFSDTAPVTTDREHVLLDDYMSRWRGHDVFATPVALRQLHTAGSVSLRELPAVPASAVPYVEQFLHRAGLRSCNAFTFPMGSAAHGLLGVFDPDPDAVDARDASALRLPVPAPARTGASAAACRPDRPARAAVAAATRCRRITGPREDQRSYRRDAVPDGGHRQEVREPCSRDDGLPVTYRACGPCGHALMSC